MKTNAILATAFFAIVGCSSPIQEAAVDPPALREPDVSVDKGFEGLPTLQSAIPARWLDTFSAPGFQPALAELSTYSFNQPDSDGTENGLTILFDILERIYDQTGDVTNLDAALGARLANVPDYPEQTLILRLAHAAWAEQNHVTPWSLKDMPEDAVRLIFVHPPVPDLSLAAEAWMESLWSSVSLSKLRGHAFIDRHLEQEISFQMYPIASKLLQPTREGTLRAAIAWVKASFFHYYASSNGESWTHEIYQDGRTETIKPGPPMFWPASLARLFDERAGGCQTTSLILEAILRSLNIPVLPISIEGHAVVYLPEGDIFIHGDPLALTQNLAVDDLIFPAQWLNEAGDDVMMGLHLEERVLDRYGDAQLLFNAPHIKRNGTDLYFSYWWDVTDEILSRWQQELPSYNIRFATDEYGMRYVDSDPAPIRTLDELSSPGVSIW